jgi:adenosine deaminase
MNNLRASIEILFRDICPDSRIEKYLSSDVTVKVISKTDFSQKAFKLLSYYSHDEIDNLYQYICHEWSWEKKRNISYLYQLINRFTSNTLTEEQGNPRVQYEQILRWRDLSHKLGEDLFICNFLSYKDHDLGRERSSFNWRPVIDSDNSRLRTLLSKGVAENHFHLWGSSPYGDLSWIALMNNTTDQKQRFKDMLKDGLLENTDHTEEVEDYHLYFLVLKAALIRAHLFKILKTETELFDNNLINELIRGKSNKHESVFLASQIPSIQNEIELLKYEFGLKYDDTTVADYAIAKNTSLLDDNGISLLTGERWFLYTMFSRLHYPDREDNISRYNDLFYIYLLCKSKFREELLQVNTKTGFANFSKYQKRKDIFLEPYPVFIKAMSSIAVRTSKRTQNIVSFETRITPSHVKYISGIDKNINERSIDRIDRYMDASEQQLSDHFYTVHFIKKKEKPDSNNLLSDIKPRHWKLRDEIKNQTTKLVTLRDYSKKEASRIYGIDAASNEIDARPEIFATEFRLLQNHHPLRYHADVKEYLNIPEMPRLHATFHAGEDFLDIVDGLRYIDESIKFLELGEGDRIGHALALGIDVEDYYAFKHNYLLLPKQNLLDNYSWLLSRIAKYGLNEYMSLQAKLLHDFRVLYYEVYADAKNREDKILECDPILYYQAWTLRGDNPEKYITGSYEDDKLDITLFDKYSRAKYPNEQIRKNNLVLDYLCAYQYNGAVKKKGAEITEYEVSPDYIKAVKVIQKKMQKEIAQKHIAIECNPSSNVLIGTFKRYDKHPIVNFYNLGLTYDQEKLKDCPQLMVSINTDDQGVFNTYLENEYALMAKALEKARDKEGNPLYNSAMIHDWLERIRQMGLEMSFRDNN